MKLAVTFQAQKLAQRYYTSASIKERRYFKSKYLLLAIIYCLRELFKYEILL
jgi:hypothetical protein